MKIKLVCVHLTKCFYPTCFYDIISQKDNGKDMKKVCFSAVLAGVLFGWVSVCDAAYPAYPSYMVNNSNGTIRANGSVINLPSTSSRVVSTSGAFGGYVPSNAAAAASPNRVTGALPRVGSTNTTAGRSYYQPSDYDRLADSGLYIGLSVAYAASIMGSIGADYTGEENAYYVPGAFKSADYASDTVIPLQISVGAAINNDIRVDFSYLRYSNLEYPDTVQTATGYSAADGAYVAASVDGGAITSNATMLNVYYNIDSYTGYLAGGMLRPYIGAGVGISLNTIADYVVYDGSFYPEIEDLGFAGQGELTAVSDIYAYHNGGTTEQLTYMLEAGLTTEMESGLKLDFFVRYANLGKVKTSGSVIVSQTEWLGDGAGGEYEAPYDSVFQYTNWTETGKLSTIDVGARLRLQF